MPADLRHPGVTPRPRAHRGAVRGGRHGPWRLAALVVVLAGATPLWADLWYQHYEKAARSMAEGDWRAAIEELNQAIERRGDSGARVRTYGMRTTDYFPYLKLGIAYYGLGELEAALQAFETEERLGAVRESEEAWAELERTRERVLEAQAEAADREQARIRAIVAESLSKARELEEQGELEEAIAAVGRALALAPDEPEATALLARLQQAVRSREEARDRERKVAEWVAQGKRLAGRGRYDEASSLFRQALSETPDDPDIQRLFDNSRGRLLEKLEAEREDQDRTALVAGGLEEARGLERDGRLAEALDRLQSVLAIQPDNPDALEIQERLVAASRTAEEARTRQASITRHLELAESLFAESRFEQSLAAAHQALALAPDNARAIALVGRAYRQINRQLMGARNIPPAIRFDDLREPLDDGSRAQLVGKPDFRLSGVVIDDSPVEIVFYDGEGAVVPGDSDSQPLGGLFLTEFSLGARLGPGAATFRLVATDSENLSSGGEYTVVYRPPLLRSPRFWGASSLLAGALAAALLAQRSRRRARLRRRRFNPYVAGAPVLDQRLFFGREALLDRILQTIHNNSLLLYGERRIGKTSLQHQIKRRLEQLDDPDYAFYPVYIDLQGTPEERFFSTLAEEIFEDLAPHLDGLQPSCGPSGRYRYRDLVRDVRAVLKRLQAGSEKRVKLVLLIDEVDELNDYNPRINQRLRGLFMKSFAEDLVAVVSGVHIKKQWEREGSPWYNFFEEIELEGLKEEAAKDLVERPLNGVLKMEAGLADRILALTDGKPYLIQKMCMSLVSRAYEKGRRTLTVADAEALGRPEGP